ncbi:hypothetical protein [Rhodococcus triatomae]
MNTRRNVMAAAAAVAAALTMVGAGPAYADHPATPNDARTWGACPTVNPDRASDKVVREYSETTNRAVLKCGNEKAGYWHIYKRHVYDNPEWEMLASIENTNWRNLVDIAIAKALDVPEYSVLQPNGTTCYTAQLYLVNHANGAIEKTINPSIVVAPDGVIVTAFPGGGCR